MGDNPHLSLCLPGLFIYEETDMNQIKQLPLFLSILLFNALITALSILSFTFSFSVNAKQLEEVVVTAELLESNVLQLPNSVSVIDTEQLELRTAQHLEDILNLTPNVNYSTGASRGRFIQIRGIGERSEFQEPTIHSVGVIVDGVDFTGIASVASILDVDQIEVLRGPQGTLFGANALAGLINIVSNKPTNEFYAKFGILLEDFNGRGIDGVISAPINDNTGYRLAVKQYQSDGFQEDGFLNRDDTNNFDETTARVTLVSQLNEKLNLDASLFLADIDNGFDGFSLDNTRQTYSDNPGVDTAETVAGAIKAHYQIHSDLRFESILSHADSETEYRYDEDWSHPGICDGTPCDSALFGFDWFYESVDQYLRDNSNTSVDLKFVSQNDSKVDWVVGAYLRDQSIDLLRNYTFNDGPFTSTIDTTNMAIYGQADFQLSEQWSFTTGLRFENLDIAYVDNNGSDLSKDENQFGGRIALEYQSDGGAFYYGLISRGYKSGGFNTAQSISGDQREFDTETMTNYEIGIKNTYLDGALRIQTAVFYQDRNDVHSKQSIVASIATGELGGTCPCSFTDFTDNAATGTNKGIEVELDWNISDKLNVFANIGLLDAEFGTLLTFDNVNADRDNGIPYNLKGRDQSHAPSYQLAVGGSFNITDQWQLSGSVEAKDEFYFSDRHDEKSDAYELLNLELTYKADNWSIALYGKNLTDEDVKTRGFGSFGNDPRKFYETEPYNQFAAPRVVGLKASMEF